MLEAFTATVYCFGSKKRHSEPGAAVAMVQPLWMYVSSCFPVPQEEMVLFSFRVGVGDNMLVLTVRE